MSHIGSDIRYQLALANRIVAHEGVIDAFGHISIRHPDDPQRYFLSCSRSPQLVTPDDILEYDLDSRPVEAPKQRQYSERVIHGAIYQARPDVHCVCHHHAAAFMPLLATRTAYRPVFHSGAAGGIDPPFWDQNSEFGDTNMLVKTADESRSLAKALGQHWMVLMVRHGVTVVGRGLPETVYRCIFSCHNADYQTRALMIGKPDYLSPGEVRLAGELACDPVSIERAWEFWCARLEADGAMPEVPAG